MASMSNINLTKLTTSPQLPGNLSLHTVTLNVASLPTEHTVLGRARTLVCNMTIANAEEESIL